MYGKQDAADLIKDIFGLLFFKAVNIYPLELSHIILFLILWGVKNLLSGIELPQLTIYKYSTRLRYL